MSQKYKKDSLGSRMKRYEKATGTQLIPRMPTIIRVDGKAFHTFTRKINAENDPTHATGPSHKFHRVMQSTAHGLAYYMQNTQFVYHQSDEISILLVDYQGLQSQQWFGGKVQKMASVSASMASAYFNVGWGFEFEPASTFPSAAVFDSRVFQLPKEEVANYFIWRQQDATRNSVQMLARKYFSHKETHKKNNSQLQDMLMLQHDINWNDQPTWTKRGACIIPDTPSDLKPFSTPWFDDNEIPIFTADRNYIEKFVYPVADE